MEKGRMEAHGDELYKIMLGIVVHICNTNTGKVEAGGLRIQGQPGYIVRPCLKRKTKTTTTIKICIASNWSLLPLRNPGNQDLGTSSPKSKRAGILL
jgi:hypothetical protein